MVISAIIDRLDRVDLEELVDMKSRKKTNLEKSIDQLMPQWPNISSRTKRRWVEHFIQWGETPSETRAREVKINRTIRKQRMNSKWQQHHTDFLKQLLEENS